MYKIDLKEAIEKIKKAKAKRVLLQLPDGLKPRAIELANELKKSGAEILIWAGSNFGGCDVPTYVEKEGIDMILNVGHSEFLKG